MTGRSGRTAAPISSVTLSSGRRSFRLPPQCCVVQRTAKHAPKHRANGVHPPARGECSASPASGSRDDAGTKVSSRIHPTPGERPSRKNDRRHCCPDKRRSRRARHALLRVGNDKHHKSQRSRHGDFRQEGPRGAEKGFVRHHSERAGKRCARPFGPAHDFLGGLQGSNAPLSPGRQFQVQVPSPSRRVRRWLHGRSLAEQGCLGAYVGTRRAQGWGCPLVVSARVPASKSDRAAHEYRPRKAVGPVNEDRHFALQKMVD